MLVRGLAFSLVAHKAGKKADWLVELMEDMKVYGVVVLLVGLLAVWKDFATAALKGWRKEARLDLM